MKQYYYPISSTSLATIFGHACILPASLYKNRLPDIQNKFENFVLLTEHFGCSESDCCLQIVLTPEEERSLVDVNGGFYLYESALPISRIKKVFFEKAEQATRTISNIVLSTAFIPKYLVDNKDNLFDRINLDVINIPDNLIPLTDSVSKKYDKYNRALGAMALMRTAHEEGCNFSTHYIDLLSKFNSFIECQKKEVAEIDIKFHRVFDSHPAFLDQTVDFETLENEARDNGQFINKQKITKVIDSSNLEKNVYVCYVLYDYGVGEESHRHKIDELILDNFSSLKKGYEESCALYYGYNRGYAIFNNQYTKDGKTEIVKYQLNSLLDYYTIESVFEYCFKGVVPAKIELFDSWVKALTPPKKKKGEYLILDTIIRDKKKVILFSEEWWKNCFSYFIPKDKVVFMFMGYDASSIIIDRLLKPFAALIKEELSSDYEEAIQRIKETYSDEVNRLKDELKQCREERNHDADSPSPTEGEKPGSFEEVSPVDETEIAKKVIKLCSLKSKELKDLAKSKGCQVSRQSKLEDLVLGILRAEKYHDNTLF